MPVKAFVIASEFVALRLVAALRGAGMEVRSVARITEAVDAQARADSDIVLVEAPRAECGGCAGAGCALPSLCGRLRTAGPAALMALSHTPDGRQTVCALRAGADDCVSVAESGLALRARVRAWARRVAMPVAPAPEPSDALWTTEPELDQVATLMDGRGPGLTPKEQALLRALARRPGLARRREELLAEVWGLPAQTRSRTLDVHIGRLRAKLGADTECPWTITTVPGVGYRLEIPAWLGPRLSDLGHCAEL